MNRFAMTTLALAISVSTAPRVWAQSTSAIQVCRDGTVVRSNSLSACILHGGVDQQATGQASRGVYGPNGTGGNRGVYNGGSVNGSNRQIYGGGSDSGVFGGRRSHKSNARWHRDKDRKANNGRWNRANGDRDRDGDRDDDRRDRASREQDRQRTNDRDRYRSNDNRR